MKCCDVTSAMLNRQITIQQRAETADGAGGVTEAWSTLATVWAWVKPVSARERAYAGRIEAQVDFKAIIRFSGDGDSNPAYTADHRVIYQAKTYGIEYVTDVDGKRAWLEIGIRSAK